MTIAHILMNQWHSNLPGGCFPGSEIARVWLGLGVGKATSKFVKESLQERTILANRINMDHPEIKTTNFIGVITVYLL